MNTINRYHLLGYIFAVLMIFNNHVFASTPPGPPPIIVFPINEDVSDTVIVSPEFSKSKLDSLMIEKLRPNRGLTYLIPLSIYVKAGEYLRLSPAGTGNIHLCINQLTKNKLCEQRVSFNYTTDYYVKATIDGEVYIDNRLTDTNSPVEVTVTGGHQMPVFKLNTHSDNDFLSMLDDATVPNIHLVSNKMIITGPIAKFKQYGITNPTELMQSWDNIVTWGQQHYGFSDDLNSLHQPVEHKLLFLDVGEDGFGAMYASSYHLGTGTDSGFLRVVDTDYLNGTRGWGPWHEYGHTLQPRYLQFSGMTEVTVNITSQKIRQTLGHGSNIVSRWNNNIFPYLDQSSSEKDFFGQQLGLFDKLGLFWQLDLTFGPRFYQRMSIIMRNGYQELPFLYDVAQDKRVQVFIQQASLATGYDLREYFKHWGIPVSGETNINMNRYSRYLQPSTGMWENSDLSITKQDYEFGEDVAIHYRPKTKKIKFAYDYFRTWLPEHKVTVYVNNRYLGKIEDNQSDEFDLTVDPDNALVKVATKKRLNKGDKIKLVFETPQTNTVTYKHRVNDIRMWSNSEKDKITVKVKRSRFNRDDFTLKAYSNGYVIFSCENNACEHADVTFRNNKVLISKQYQLTPNQPVTVVIGKKNGQLENVIYAN
ncbi:hypothetical protein C0W54_15065 [Photobacterium kishitanii]|uniref:M60 family metallopeptidase n=1 Tax=Photobacterium kishitanii TaxID=318456 RepID=UPI000D175F60|nr:M60 family metallopeptidase [Photobacterium kishitanii]PSW60592.1 hypothetical protein C0W54_15065 [Photobacterium kishitanii]